MKNDVTKSGSDIVKWTFVVLCVISGIVANTVYVSQPVTIRLIAWIVLACVTLFVASRTTQGANVISFAKLSQQELRKVVWPTRQETIQITMIVVAMVTVVSLFLWLVDMGFLWSIGLLTGNRG